MRLALKFFCRIEEVVKHSKCSLNIFVSLSIMSLNEAASIKRLKKQINSLLFYLRRLEENLNKIPLCYFLIFHV